MAQDRILPQHIGIIMDGNGRWAKKRGLDVYKRQIIIEDKTGLKKNSLFGTEVDQTQDSIENFSAKIAAGKRVQKTKDFMIIARIERCV